MPIRAFHVRERSNAARAATTELGDAVRESQADESRARGFFIGKVGGSELENRRDEVMHGRYSIQVGGQAE